MPGPVVAQPGRRAPAPLQLWDHRLCPTARPRRRIRVRPRSAG